MLYFNTNVGATLPCSIGSPITPISPSSTARAAYSACAKASRKPPRAAVKTMTGDLLGRQSYIHAVRQLYVGLPHTPDRFSRADRYLAAELFVLHLPLPVIRSAFLLATARRLIRPADRSQLSPIRSLHYFLPVINEVRLSPLPSSDQRQSKFPLPQQSVTGPSG